MHFCISYWINYLNLHVVWKTVDLVQLTSEEASLSGSTLFSIEFKDLHCFQLSLYLVSYCIKNTFARAKLEVVCTLSALWDK